MNSTPNSNPVTPEEASLPAEPALFFNPHSTHNLTIILVGLNVLVFIIMLMLGAGLIEPDSLVMLKYGADYAPLTLNGDYWRLLTCCFLHFGVVHLLLNMYALWSIGPTLEMMLGTRRLLAAYIACGILSSAVSVTFQPETISAGASGAIFGLYGLFIALTMRHKWFSGDVQGQILKSSLWFIGYNIFYGFRPDSGVDNAAHIGGLLAGLLIGLLYALHQPGATSLPMRTETGWAAGVMLGVFGLTGVWVMQLPKPDRPSAALTNMRSATVRAFTQFERLDSLGSAYFSYSDSSYAVRDSEATAAVGHFVDGENLMTQLQTDEPDTNAYAHRRAIILQQYAQCKRALIDADRPILTLQADSRKREADVMVLVARLDSIRANLRTLDSLSAK